MRPTDYVVQLYSETDPQNLSSVVELKEVGSSVFLYGESGTLIAVYEANDIQKLAPLGQE
ncbi:hypothetical protein F3J34_08465 [Klebsiella sp. Ap-873]|uniref:Uncharacterized protein n=1 Tax=Cedecea neteri TaxID=158822 RepID=A0AAN0S5T2_9ENTR|nr:hypothetical protein [Cedecea neteri]AIR62136.1 hypothetical protein LH23_16200 [Cedecea neteri]NIG73629.1 hypothetical protein [Klebsiella sp. Ap-873]